MPRHPRVDRKAVAAVALGGCLGGSARFALERAVPTSPGEFPWATFGINISGALALGLLLAVVLESGVAVRYLREFGAVGVLGAYTTFSTWMVEVHHELVRGDQQLAFAYVGGSIAAGLLAAALGMAAGRSLAGRQRPRAGVQ